MILFLARAAWFVIWASSLHEVIFTNLANKNWNIFTTLPLSDLRLQHTAERSLVVLNDINIRIERLNMRFNSPVFLKLVHIVYFASPACSVTIFNIFTILADYGDFWHTK